MQPSLKAKPTEPSGGGGPARNAGSLRDHRSQIHPCELLHDHPEGSSRVLLYEDPDELGVSGLTGAGRALFMANGTLGDKDWKLQDLIVTLKTAARLVTWDIDGKLMVMANYLKVALSRERAESISSKKEAGSALTDLLAAMGVVDEAGLEFSQAELEEFQQLHKDNQVDDIKHMVRNRLLYMLYYDVWNDACSVDSELLDVCAGLRLLELIMPEFKHSKLVQVMHAYTQG